MGSSRATIVGMVLALVVMAATPTVRAVDGPTLTIGDYWRYSTNTTAAAGFSLVGQVTLSVKDRGFLVAHGSAVDVFNISVAGRGNASGLFRTPLGEFWVTGNWTLTGLESLEATGLKIVASIIDLRAYGTTQTAPFSQEFSLLVQNTTTFQILNDTWRFPLDVGDSGSVEARADFVEDVRYQVGPLATPTHSSGTATWTLGYEMESRSSTTTDAGTFDAYRIRETWPDESYEILSFAPAVGNDVHRETYNETHVKIATMDLVAYRYQVLEPTTFLRLTFAQWLIVIPIVAAVVAAAALWFLRRRRRKPQAVIEIPPPAGP